MRKTFTNRLRFAAARHPAAKRWLVFIVALCAVLKAVSASGLDLVLESAAMRGLADAGTVERLLDFERWPAVPRGRDAELPGAEPAPQQEPSPAEIDDPPEEPTAPEAAVPAEPPPPDEEPGGQNDPPPEKKPDGAAPQSVLTLFDRERLDASSISLINPTDYEPDIDALLNEPLSFSVSGDGPSVLIVHTHGSEAYSRDDDDPYEESDPWRTTDRSHSVVRVGDELAAALESYGISVLHDRELHDWPDYNGSYNRSLLSVYEYLEEYPSIRIVFDLHRDAIMDDSGTVYKTVAEIGGSICSQVLLVVGTNFSGLDHPYWQENLKLALRLQYAMEELYPSLAKPIEMTQYRYNQHTTTGSLIVEVGCNGNTLRESVDAVRYFADAAAAVILDAEDRGDTENSD